MDLPQPSAAADGPLPGAWSSHGPLSQGSQDAPSPMSPMSPMSLPVHVVTDASQLPPELLHPPAPPAPPLVIGFDCEGIDLARHGQLCVMQLALPCAIYLVDVVAGGRQLVEECKGALESPRVVKAIHDCKRDGEALYFQFGVRLQGIFDTQLAHALIEEARGSADVQSDQISFVQLASMPQYCGVAYDEKEEVRQLMRQDPAFWEHRPWTPVMLRAAADDVRFLPTIHRRMHALLSAGPNGPTRLRQLAVQSELHARCFCLGAHEWPAPVPWADDGLQGGQLVENGGSADMVSSSSATSEESSGGPVEEILSVVDVPQGLMGLVIGRRGMTIRSIKESCRAHIVLGGQKGPPDKVFIIGPVKEVRKAEAIIRGKVAR
ncbi:hypothetical protein CLOM_g11610 [Closterium sp. NIES-68]|nr:hypothetical protein CLOM_g11610 [Closterium sp. NIES-68]GJP58560.1 hypothetical protein CLOP_g438 [Closterium sp. NIES-67]